MTDQTSETLLTFPCDFTIKVFGLNTESFETTVLSIINQHLGSTDRTLQHRDSEGGKYRSYSITIEAQSKEQLDAIYRDLSAAPDIIMTL